MPKKLSRTSGSANTIVPFLRRPSIQLGLVLAVVVAIALIVLFGNPPTSTSTNLPTDINAERAYQIYQQNGAYFVDVREQSEWDEFHIPNTTLIPLGDLPNRLNEIPKDKPIVVICNSGNRSKPGRDILKQAGYTNVTSVNGGVQDWRTRGYPIEP